MDVAAVSLEAASRQPATRQLTTDIPVGELTPKHPRSKGGKGEGAPRITGASGRLPALDGRDNPA
jgi:hypothetical protein